MKIYTIHMVSEQLMWHIILANTTRLDVDKKRHRGKSIGPEMRWDVGVEQKNTNAIIESAKYMLRRPVLLRSVRAC